MQAKMKGLKKFNLTTQKTEIDSSYIAQELRQIIIETLRNIKEHAYDDSKFSDGICLAAIYARLRFGLADDLPIPHNDKLRECFKNENNS